MRQVDKWQKRFRLRRISTLAIIITFLLSISIIGLTIYGSNVGNFVITVADRSQKNLQLSETPDFAEGSTVLMPRGLSNMADCTLSMLPDDIGSINGSFIALDRSYIAYTFYLKNMSDVATAYKVNMNVTAAYRNLDDAVRVMIISEGHREIYAKPAKDGSAEQNINTRTGLSEYSVTNFVSNTMICDYVVTGLSAQMYHKYTVVLWLEGWDPECTDQLKEGSGGSLRIAMSFSTVDQ